MSDLFVGADRQAIVDDLLADFEAVKAGEGSRVMALVAPSGWGKTRIVQEFYSALAARQEDPGYWPARIVDEPAVDSEHPEGAISTLTHARRSETRSSRAITSRTSANGKTVPDPLQPRDASNIRRADIGRFDAATCPNQFPNEEIAVPTHTSDRSRFPHRANRRRPSVHFAAAIIAGAGALALLAGCSDDTTADEGPAFSPDQVQFTVPTGSGLQVYVIGEGTAGDHLRQAEQCLDHHLANTEGGASCWVFASRKALTYSKVDRDAGGMDNICWSARALQTNDGSREIEPQDESLAEAIGCPS